jgi:hypothetical protein
MKVTHKIRVGKIGRAEWLEPHDVIPEAGDSTTGPPGKDGEPGRDGAPGKDGVDGYTPIKGVDYFDGANSSVPGPAGADSTVPGPKGDTGDTGLTGADGPMTGQPVGYVVLSNDTLAQALATNINTQITVTAARTLTTTVPAAGIRCSVTVVTSGTSSFVVTFGTGFKPVGTLATGTTSARAFVVNFISNGTILREFGRTAAMVV